MHAPAARADAITVNGGFFQIGQVGGSFADGWVCDPAENLALFSPAFSVMAFSNVAWFANSCWCPSNDPVQLRFTANGPASAHGVIDGAYYSQFVENGEIAFTVNLPPLVH